MRNHQLYGTRDLVERFMSTLRTLAPSGTLNRLDVPTWHDGSRAHHATLPWFVGDSAFTLLLNVKLAGGFTDAGVPRGSRAPGEVPVSIAPFISVGERRKIADAGGSYWDGTGNLLLSNALPFMFVMAEGASRDPSPTAEPRELLSLKGRAASQAVTTLLRSGYANNVRDFAKDSGVGVGTASRVISLLRHENFLAATGSDAKAGGAIALERGKRVELAERLAQDYSFTKTHRAKRYYSHLGRDGALRAINQCGVNYEVTGLTAASQIFSGYGETSPLPPADLWVYTDDVARIEREASLVPDPRGGDILLAEGGPWDSSTVPRGGFTSELPLSYSWRVAVDLLSQPGRHAAVGLDLAKLIAAK